MRRALPAVPAALGLVLVVAGVVVFGTADHSPADFGWTSYAPLEPEAYQSELTLTFPDRWTVLWTGAHLAGALLTVLGLLVLTGWAAGCSAAGRDAGRPARTFDGRVVRRRVVALRGAAFPSMRGCVIRNRTGWFPP